MIPTGMTNIDVNGMVNPAQLKEKVKKAGH